MSWCTGIWRGTCMQSRNAYGLYNHRIYIDRMINIFCIQRSNRYATLSPYEMNACNEYITQVARQVAASNKLTDSPAAHARSTCISFSVWPTMSRTIRLQRQINAQCCCGSLSFSTKSDFEQNSTYIFIDINLRTAANFCSSTHAGVIKSPAEFCRHKVESITWPCTSRQTLALPLCHL